MIAIRRELRPFRLTRVFWKAAAVLELPSGMVGIVQHLSRRHSRVQSRGAGRAYEPVLENIRRPARRPRRRRTEPARNGSHDALAAGGLPLISSMSATSGSSCFPFRRHPAKGVQYASQGGAAATTISAPGTAAVSDLVYENVTNAIKGATTSNVAVRVCSNAKGLTRRLA